MCTRRLRAIGTAATLVALLATTTASATRDGEAFSGELANSACVLAESLLFAPSGTASVAVPAALSEYDDFIEDVVTAPDICAANLVTNDNVWMTMGVHVHDRSEFAADDGYRIYLDTDSNSATGAPTEAGPLPGAELALDLLDETSTLSAWDGVAFTAATPQPEILSGWADGYGPVLRISRAVVGNPSTLRIVLSTENGADRDLAPDTGSWGYTVTPLRLVAGRLATTAAKAGGLLVAGMEVTRSDFEIPLDEGRITCGASIAGRKVAGRGRFTDELVTCAWRLPRSAVGKRFSGSVGVMFQGVVAKRAFGIRVR